ncbi:uncharacterized protein C18orf25 homolog isoform X3 [Latimeria chalumnae]|uniref:uncharacterized protein C18orf25 homolog isoform X3 n=1 Tax=Latimeria chalumnae TaxID=7897 RepID=UPI00313B2933
MTMEAVGKAEELVDSDLPPKSSEGSGQTEEGPLEPMGSSQKDENHMLVATADADSGMLSTMPCLLMELRRDSSESQLASTESDKPSAGRAYESDSSNHCMLSPSSSGHLADSDTLSSADERGPSRADPADAAGEGAGSAGGRKSRRSRSESETSTMAAKKNRQSSEKQNGKVKVHRSQKHKERIRLLRQKREAAARKKYNLLQDSSTSDSDLTCDSSTSSSEDEEEVSGSSKTITAEIPGGLPVIAHYDLSDTNSDPEVVNVDNLLAAAAVQEHSAPFRKQEVNRNSWRDGELLEGLQTQTGQMDATLLTNDDSACGPVQMNEQINIASSDSEVEIVGVQENTSRLVPPACSPASGRANV